MSTCGLNWLWRIGIKKVYECYEIIKIFFAKKTTPKNRVVSILNKKDLN